MSNGYKILNVNCQEKRGGGLALIHRPNIQVKTISNGAKCTFEFATWECSVASTNLAFTGIYHLPYSDRNKCTDAMFLDDWAEFLESLLTEHTNNIICGDFNLHIDDLNNPDAQVFLHMVNAFGLNNNVTFPTHQSGHTLDLILSECISGITVNKAVPGSFLSDNTSILCDVNIDKPPLEVRECTYRKLKDIDKSEFQNLVDDKLSNLGYNLDEMVWKYEESLQSILNELAPEKSRRMVIRPTNPWFSESLKKQKKIMRDAGTSTNWNLTGQLSNMNITNIDLC